MNISVINLSTTIFTEELKELEIKKVLIISNKFNLKNFIIKKKKICGIISF